MLNSETVTTTHSKESTGQVHSPRSSMTLSGLMHLDPCCGCPQARQLAPLSYRRSQRSTLLLVEVYITEVWGGKLSVVGKRSFCPVPHRFGNVGAWRWGSEFFCTTQVGSGSMGL